MRTFGKYAKERIRRLEKSQKELARLLAVSPAYISQIFTGKKNPPDLGRPKNRWQLRVWSEFLEVPEDQIIDMIRYELHRVPMRPEPRYRVMRELLVKSLNPGQRKLADDLQLMDLHPAEGQAVRTMARMYLILQEDWSDGRAHGVTRFREFCNQVISDREFVEGPLVAFFSEIPFSWTWDPERNEAWFSSRSHEINEALERLDRLFATVSDRNYVGSIPAVGHVSAGEGFEYTDGGYSAGEGFEQVPLPPGVNPILAPVLYCVRVRGDSLREFFSDGTLLFVKPESWEEVKDGDLVIFKDRREGRAFVKKVEFAGKNLILKPMNQLYKNLVVERRDLMLLERVVAIVL